MNTSTRCTVYDGSHVIEWVIKSNGVSQIVGDALLASKATAQDRFRWVQAGLANIDDGSADPSLAHQAEPSPS